MNRLKLFRRRLRTGASLVAATLMLGSVPALAQTTAAQISAQLEQGRRIYVEGILPSGAPLQGTRGDNVAVSGAKAACITCHRRSGMGGVEGDLQVSPITGRFLYAVRADMALAIMDPRVGRMMNQAHAPYTDEKLSTAIRTGVNSSGRTLNVVMPHFTLDEAEMQALIAYLKQLSGQWSPGANADTIRFATVIAPGIPAERKKILVDMLRAAFAQKNGSTVVGKQRSGRRHMVTGPEQILGTERKWELDVWELQGPSDTWAVQLDANYRDKPVFALMSGLGEGTWAPVHEFCERQKVPCWFPSVDLAPDEGQAIYPVYFSRGVALEAQVFAKFLTTTDQPRPQRLLQVYRDADVGRGAAAALSHALAGSGIAVENRVIGDPAKDSLRAALTGVKATDAIMFWLRPDDLAALEKIAPPSASAYFSGELGNAERGPLPESWRKSAHMVYPYELPEMRENNLTYFRMWLKMRNLPLKDEVLQSEIYFAVTFMTDTVSEMLDNLQRDYLLERAEDMMGKRETGKAEGATRDRASLGTPEERARRYPNARKLDESAGLNLEPGQGPNLIAMRRGTTVYPRLTLGSGQRFASKGAYIVRFAGEKHDQVVADSDWLVP
jgi:hypothetical protein